jgi:hypothetical protein
LILQETRISLGEAIEQNSRKHASDTTPIERDYAEISHVLFPPVATSHGHGP